MFSQFTPLLQPLFQPLCIVLRWDGWVTLCNAYKHHLSATQNGFRAAATGTRAVPGIYILQHLCDGRLRINDRIAEAQYGAEPEQ
jgi:hypothetical protein